MPAALSSRPRRILVIDDNDAIHADFIKTLSDTGTPTAKFSSAKAALFGQPTVQPAPQRARPRFEVVSARQGQEGVDKAEAARREGIPFNVAFVDMRMPPGLDGVQTIQRLWQADPDLQVVICTAYSDYSWEAISEKLGTSDRLLILKKPFDPVEVSQLACALSEKWSLNGQATLKIDQLERMVEDRTADLRHAALHDKLTGLGNRALLRDRINAGIERNRSNPGFHFALLFLDFDRFKIVNDSYGHDAGDELLIEISGRLRATLRSADGILDAESSTAARLGGDEFVVLATDLKEPADSAVVGEQFLNALAKPYTLKGQTISCTASIGITTSARGYSRAEEMLRDADTAMYHAKASGKGCYVNFDAKMHEEAMARMEMESELHHVIERGELFVQYQPIVCMESGKVRSLEALVRWNHPRRGLVGPMEFIPCCEETGMIVPIGLWVLEEGCRQLARWRLEYPKAANVCLNVNLSVRQLSAPQLVERVGRIIQDTKVDPASLVLEITESAMLRGGEASIRTLSQLKSLGIRLHMDDFGTGYSSLSCLHRLPLDGIKIDKSFISSIGERRDLAAVVQAVVTLAQNLGMNLTAEGVETGDQLAMLQSMNCDAAQGYFFSRPLNAESAGKYIAAHCDSAEVLRKAS